MTQFYVLYRSRSALDFDLESQASSSKKGKKKFTRDDELFLRSFSVCLFLTFLNLFYGENFTFTFDRSSHSSKSRIHNVVHWIFHISFTIRAHIASSFMLFSKSLPRAWALITAKIFMYMRIFPIWACRDCFFGFNTQSPREAHEIHTKHMHLFGGFKLKNFEKHKRSWKKHYSARKNATSSTEGWTKNAYERVFKSIFFFFIIRLERAVGALRHRPSVCARGIIRYFNFFLRLGLGESIWSEEEAEEINMKKQHTEQSDEGKMRRERRDSIARLDRELQRSDVVYCQVDIKNRWMI